jgi:hypothetical protein
MQLQADENLAASAQAFWAAAGTLVGLMIVGGWLFARLKGGLAARVAVTFETFVT